ncbi:putative isomerase YbhE [Tricholoma matsutake]|nr:putative isomerase YbhE [Tricholoma matsutake 945]
MVKFTILAGGFSSFIASYLFDSDASTLTLVTQTQTGENPSWIASHPQNTSILYAVNEISPVGNIQSFIVNPGGGLTLIDTVSSRGDSPTFTSPLSTGEVTAVNFGSPNCLIIATIPGDPLQFQKDPLVVEFPVGNGPSHPHMSLEFGGEVYVPDLGADKIWRLGKDRAGKYKVQGQIDVEPGSGPRHIAIRDNILFTLNEKRSTLTAQNIPPAPNGTTLPLMANVSIIPSSAHNPHFAAGEIIISTPSQMFPDPLIYVSNRNLDQQPDAPGDSIAIFEFVRETGTGTGGKSPCNSPSRMRAPSLNFHPKRQASGQSGYCFNLVAQVFTPLKQIRSMSIGPIENGGDEFLIAGAAAEGGISMYRRVEGGRNLAEIARNEEIAARTSFVFDGGLR